MKKIILILTLLLVLVTACKTEQVVGGDVDEYGCKPSTGYAWSDDVGACIRDWELDESQKEAAKLVIAPISYRPVIVTKVETLDCEGCFDVYISNGQGETRMMVRDNKIFHEDVAKCESDDDCVPRAECHPRSCINKDYLVESDQPEICTMMFDNQAAYNAEDCLCINNFCENKNLKKTEPMTQNLCESAGGNYNECSNKCMLDSQGEEGVACTRECQQLCECAGFAGFSCPDGYECILNSEMVDALGYCQPS